MAVSLALVLWVACFYMLDVASIRGRTIALLAKVATFIPSGFYANALAFCTWLTITTAYILLGMRSGHDIRTVTTTITMLGIVMGFACAWCVWTRLRSENDDPLWIWMFFIMGVIGSQTA